MLSDFTPNSLGDFFFNRTFYLFITFSIVMELFMLHFNVIFYLFYPLTPHTVKMSVPNFYFEM